LPRMAMICGEQYAGEISPTAGPALRRQVRVAKLVGVTHTCVPRPALRHRRLDLPTFRALQALMASGGLRVSGGLAAAIRAQRNESGVSPETIAEQLNLGERDVEAIEGVALSASQLVGLAHALGVDLVWFIEHEPSLLTGRGAGEPLDAEGGMPDPREGLDLMMAFTAIKDPQARQAVLALAQRFAAEDGGPTEGEEQ